MRCQLAAFAAANSAGAYPEIVQAHGVTSPPSMFPGIDDQMSAICWDGETVSSSRMRARSVSSDGLDGGLPLLGLPGS
ncbi:MAG: hypothetical protein K0Q46_3172 [Rhodococcus erythropolis]|jgi:hypothetical protein|nr:hypothetical protein [Rhodococcus erythropolis]